MKPHKQQQKTNKTPLNSITEHVLNESIAVHLEMLLQSLITASEIYSLIFNLINLCMCLLLSPKLYCTSTYKIVLHFFNSQLELCCY